MLADLSCGLSLPTLPLDGPHKKCPPDAPKEQDLGRPAACRNLAAPVVARQATALGDGWRACAAPVRAVVDGVCEACVGLVPGTRGGQFHSEAQIVMWRRRSTGNG